MSALHTLVDRAIFLSAEHQAHFAQVIGESPRWDVDFERPVLQFATTPPLRLRPHLLGSYSERERTWHWAWDNISDLPEPVIGLAEELRRLAQEEGMDEYASSDLDVPRDSDLPFRLVLAAKALSGIYAHYPAEAGGGTQAWLLVDGGELALPEPSILRIGALVAQSLQATEVSDHRAALTSYIALRGLASRERPEGGLRVLAADGGADVEFDSLNRITRFTKVELDETDRELVSAASPVPLQAPRVAATAPEDEVAGAGAGRARAAGPQEESWADPRDAGAPQDQVSAEDSRDKEPPQDQVSAGDLGKDAHQDEPEKKRGLFSKLFGR